MFLMRRAKPDDVDSLLKLARMVHFINLPPDREIISSKVTWSRNCFLLAADDEGAPIPTKKHDPRSDSSSSGVLTGGIKDITGRSPLFMFVLEDLETQGVIGTSQIIAKMGGPGAPNVSLQLGRKDMFSQSLQMGVTHTVAKLTLDESSPTEIGGLILQPSFRGHKLKLGRFLSVVRFHFMGLHRRLFSQRVLAEMMGPIDADGHNPFWEYCTRCFINLTYEQADKFCQQSKEFILTLFPREEIYLTLIAPEARAVVGQVGPETVPARRMLEQLGFKYHHRVDPFDGGPHLEARMDELAPVQATRRAKLAEPVDVLKGAHHGIVSTLDDDGEFRAAEVPFDLDRSGRVVLSKEVFTALAASTSQEAGLTPTPMPIPAAKPDLKLAGVAATNGSHAADGKGGKPGKAGKPRGKRPGK